METELIAMMLSFCSKSDLSVSEAVRKMGGSHDKTMALIKEVKEGGLLNQQALRSDLVGRPKHCLSVTPLGEEFLKEYRHLRNLPLRSSERDIKKALHQAELARRLVATGVSPYARLKELNRVARNIARTAEAKHNPR